MGLISPTLPSVGQDRGNEEVDAINTLAALVALVNGNIDGFNLAASAFVPYKRLADGLGVMVAADSTGVRLFDASGTSFADGAAAAKPPSCLVIPSSNPWLLAGKTPKLRLSAAIACNNVAPGAGVVTFGLRPLTISGSGGSIIYTSGAVAVTRAVTPVQASVVSQVSADIDVPAAGLYTVVAQDSAAVAANAVLSLLWSVELHHV